LKRSIARVAGRDAVELVLGVLPAFGSGSKYDSVKGLSEFMTPARVTKVITLRNIMLRNQYSNSVLNL
jgi:hypothetical protein